MVLLVVAMAIVNVASLLLVRAAARVREFSVRYSLGATNRQILRQLLVEGLLIGAAGAAIGLLLAVPLAAAIGVLMRFALRRYLESPLYTGLPERRPDEVLPPPGRKHG